MHGTKFDQETWKKIQTQASLGNKIYMPTTTYPDEEALKIVMAACELTGSSADTILEDIGEFIAPTLISMYDVLIDPKWGTVEMLLNTEQTIHAVVRRKIQSPNHLDFDLNSSVRMNSSSITHHKGRWLRSPKALLRGWPNIAETRWRSWTKRIQMAVLR